MKINEAELKKKLSPEQYAVLREKATERPFTSPLLKNKGKGMYTCAVCGAELFSSDAKFDSGTGWPSFDSAKNVKLEEDTSLGMKRIEVICKVCDSHLGHVFPHDSRTGKRYCINGCALEFKK